MLYKEERNEKNDRREMKSERKWYKGRWGEVIDRGERGNGRKIRRNQNKSWKNY